MRLLTAALLAHFVISANAAPSATLPTEGIERKKLWSESVSLLESKKYDEIERRIAELRTSKAAWVDGLWHLASFCYGLYKTNEEPAEVAFTKQIAALREWTNARPNSANAKIFLARALHDYAWKARGAGMADTVSEDQWRVFNARLALAESVLSRAEPEGRKFPEFFVTKQLLALSRNATAAEYNKIFDAAVAFEPTYCDFYFEKARYLTPIWFGNPGDVERFIETAVNTFPKEERDRVYTKIVWSLRRARAYGNIYKETKLSWPTVKRGFESLMKDNPDPLYAANEFCRHAAFSGERALVKSLMENVIKDRVDVRAWGSVESYAETKRLVKAQ